MAGNESKLLPTGTGISVKFKASTYTAAWSFHSWPIAVSKQPTRAKSTRDSPPCRPAKRTLCIHVHRDKNRTHTRAMLILGRNQHPGGGASRAGPAPQFTPPTRSLSPAPRLVSLLPPRALASLSPSKLEVWAGRFSPGGLFLSPEPRN